MKPRRPRKPRPFAAVGFQRRANYYKSNIWYNLRREVFEAKGEQCVLCRGLATQVHHSRYKVADLLGKTLEHLHPICRPCHQDIEFDGDRKRTTRQARIELFRRLAPASYAGCP